MMCALDLELHDIWTSDKYTEICVSLYATKVRLLGEEERKLLHRIDVEKRVKLSGSRKCLSGGSSESEEEVYRPLRRSRA